MSNTNTLPYELYSNQQIRNYEALAIKAGICSYSLMQRAAKAAFLLFQEQWPTVKHVMVICGGGNNGGDGYEVAALAKRAGLKVTVYYLSEPGKLSDAAKKAYHTACTQRVEIVAFNEAVNFEETDLIIDAMLGTGLKGTVKEPYAKAIALVNQAQKPVLAIDVASGLDSDLGIIHGDCVKADKTMTIIGLKQGLFTGDAANVCGEIYCNDLDISKQIFNQQETKISRVNYNALRNSYLLPRNKASHKGDFGHAVVIGGDHGMAGAITMAAIACARTGAGLTSVATQKEHVEIILAKQAEVMAHGISTQQDLQLLLNKATVCAIGPGLGQSSWSQLLFSKVMEANVPLVVDADALNLLAKHPSKQDHWILTPHPGEAARLLNCTSKDIQNNRYQAVTKLQSKYGGTIVLKGSGSLICDVEQKIYVATVGNPGMASGGMGDVLTGIITGLLAQKIPLAAAAKLGVMLHGKACDDAAKEKGERGLLALDIIPYLRTLLNP